LHSCQPRIADKDVFEGNAAPVTAHKLAQLDPETAIKAILHVDPTSPPVDEDEEPEGHAD
jgi:hypothetical protein